MDEEWSDEDMYIAIPLHLLNTGNVIDNVKEKAENHLVPDSAAMNRSLTNADVLKQPGVHNAVTNNPVPDQSATNQVTQAAAAINQQPKHDATMYQPIPDDAVMDQSVPDDVATNQWGQDVAETTLPKPVNVAKKQTAPDDTAMNLSALIGSKKNQAYLQESSDDNVPLIQIANKLRARSNRERKRNYTVFESQCASSDNNDSDFDANYVPSSSSSHSDEFSNPTAGVRKRKWMRKIIRPLKREQGRQYARNKPTKQSNVTYNTTGNATEQNDLELQNVLQKSKTEHNLNTMLKRFAEKRITNLLSSNGLERQQIQPDGNCFFNAVIHQDCKEMTVTELRSKLCTHLRENEQHYTGYISKSNAQDELEMSENYGEMVTTLGQDGIWNVEMSDVLPLATANLLFKNITIYTSRLNSPIIRVTPDLGTDIQIDSRDIKLSYLAIPGHEHYDSCVISLHKHTAISEPRCNSSTAIETKSDDGEHHSLTKTPSKRTSADKCATPRKKANYVSPKKLKLSRKRTPNVQQWKKNIRKNKRNTGLAYISASTKREIGPKYVQPSTCKNCKNKCTENISEEIRQHIFDSYYDKTMSFERKRDFICQHVEVVATSNRYGRTKKHQSRKYFLSVGSQRIKVCKSFFTKTLCIGTKVIDCTLKRKQCGKYSGTDLRGKHTPANKTDTNTKTYIKRHIESFPVVESHYMRKKTTRKFLDQNLSIRKMHELYKSKCQEDGVIAASERVYRDVFCNDYNRSFHKPKTDACGTCNKYIEKKKSGNVSTADEVIYNEHLQRKEQARLAKDEDKKRRKEIKNCM